ncbi:MAG: PQQ-dependent sugar dehydrogenase [Bacteroidota bacterium]|nr:PQQ-dependent sugar dehydrogenase [Bacteroidota bacterium]
MKIIFQLIIVSIFFSFFSQEVLAQKLAAIPYVSGINSPIDLKNCGDDRLFVADRAGRIRIINGDGTLRPIPFLNITTKISSNNSEEGFLGIAFSPDYKASGKFYVDYTSNIAGKLTSVIEEYQVSAADSNVADPASALKIITQVQPFSNHNGGNLMFGKDGYLYINFGDGGSGGDPFGNAQNKNTFLGKILRVDISKSSSIKPYEIPTTNPFYNDTAVALKKEIWAYGVRNPFRSSVDKLTGDLWIADVGQGAVEEIDYQAVNAVGGRNYGWNIMEGKSCYSPPTGCNKAGLTLPIYDYPHPLGFAIIGGYVSRTAQSKSLFGMYIFSDFVSKWIDGIRQSHDTLAGPVTHLIPAANDPGNPISFGEDKYGDQYIIFNGNGTIYKLQDTSSIRRPKAYLTPVNTRTGSYTLQALQGKDLSYQWMKNGSPIPGATASDYNTSVVGTYTLEVTNSLGFKDTSDIFLLGSSINYQIFSAQKIPNGLIQLIWKTNSEQNVTGFFIQRRKQNEANFSNLGFVDSKSINGFSNSELDYSFNDSSASNYKKLFYRLQVQHADSSISYSDVRVITSEPDKNGFTIFPNPARKYAHLCLNQFSAPLTLLVYGSDGKRIFEQLLREQNSEVLVPVSKGVYLLEVCDQDGKNKVRKKLLVD